MAKNNQLKTILEDAQHHFPNLIGPDLACCKLNLEIIHEALIQFRQVCEDDGRYDYKHVEYAFDKLIQFNSGSLHLDEILRQILVGVIDKTWNELTEIVMSE